MPFHPLTPERPITVNEALVVRWLLENAAMRDVAAHRALPVEDFRVVAKCDCGCASVAFVHTHAPEWILADAPVVYPDGKRAGAILWGDAEQIHWLEMYEMDPVADRFPELANLRTWEEMSGEAPAA